MEKNKKLPKVVTDYIQRNEFVGVDVLEIDGGTYYSFKETDGEIAPTGMPQLYEIVDGRLIELPTDNVFYLLGLLRKERGDDED